MSGPFTETSETRAQLLRKEMLGNGATEREVAAALRCSVRKIQRLRLPHTKIGGTKIYDVPTSAELLRRRSRVNASDE